jgi:hypothetical protein
LIRYHNGNPVEVPDDEREIEPGVRVAIWNPNFAVRVTESSSDETLGIVRGHLAHLSKFVDYPHRCPGENCAIAKWIRRHRFSE